MVSLKGCSSHRTPRDMAALHYPCAASSSTVSALTITSLLINLQLINLRRQLRQNLVSLLVVFELSCNQIRQIPKWLRRVQNLYLD